MIKICRGSGHPTFGAVWLDIGRLRLIWCAPSRPSVSGYPDIPGHPNKWMIVWRRRLPEYVPGPPRRWKPLPAKLDEADRREFAVERADPDEPEKIRLLERFAPIACFQCDHSNAAKARKEIVEIIRAIRQREQLPDNSPMNCCRQQQTAREGVADVAADVS